MAVEFKSEARGPMNDTDLVEAVACLANSGVSGMPHRLFIGVEDDGIVSGARPRHGTSTDPRRIKALIRNNTVPSLDVTAIVVALPEGEVLGIEVFSSDRLVSTSRGRTIRRVLGFQGPECRPMSAAEISRFPFQIGAQDYTATVIEGATREELDPFEVARLRQTIEAFPGSSDRVLLDLNDDELLQALELLVTREDGSLAPTIAGLLMVGRETVLSRRIPTNEILVQVFGRGSDLLLNRRFAGPIVRVVGEIEQLVAARNTEEELLVGGYRVPIPNFSPEAFREALHNAVLHRDYTENSAVHLQLSEDQLTLTNPGGFLPGITPDNFIVHEPKPRNRALAGAFQRIGLVERSGRGIDRIFEGQLRFGRPAPDYSRSDAMSVRLTLAGGTASRELTAFVFQEIAAGRRLGVRELLTLDLLRRNRRAGITEIARAIQAPDGAAREIAERMVVWGILEARGERRGRWYLLSQRVLSAIGEPARSIRDRGFSSIQQRAMVMDLLDRQGEIRRADVMELCHLTGLEASRLLSRMANEGQLERRGAKRGTFYVKSTAEG